MVVVSPRIARTPRPRVDKWWQKRPKWVIEAQASLLTLIFIEKLPPPPPPPPPHSLPQCIAVTKWVTLAEGKVHSMNGNTLPLYICFLSYLLRMETAGTQRKKLSNMIVTNLKMKINTTTEEQYVLCAKKKIQTQIWNMEHLEIWKYGILSI